MYETLPFFSGRSTLEGVYNQAATTTHPVYYLASELLASSPNPCRSRTYSRFDPQSALGRPPAGLPIRARCNAQGLGGQGDGNRLPGSQVA